MTAEKTHRRLRPGDDRGSLPLTMLAIIALSGIIGALVVTVIGSTRQARFDEQYTEVIQAADAGAQQGAALLIRGIDAETKQDAAIGTTWCGASAATPCPATGVADGIAYEWQAVKVDFLEWLVTGQATIDGVTRSVVIQVEDVPRFFVAAFSDRGFEMRGGNGADSYGATAWYTGNGIVASNETIRMNGASTGVDAVHLYNWDNNADFGRCEHVGGSDCTDVLTQPDAILPSARIGYKLEVGGPLLETDFIQEQLASCPTSPPQEYKTSTYNGGSGVLGTAGTHTVYCFSDFTANRDITIQGTVDVYVYGDLLFGTPPNNDVQVNCGGACSVGASNPEATALTFYVNGSGDPSDPSTVKFGNHSAVAAGIYAPRSTCAGNPSNAQGSVYGSLICDTISNQGGWSFHYDDRLREIGIGEYAVREWRET